VTEMPAAKIHLGRINADVIPDTAEMGRHVLMSMNVQLERIPVAIMLTVQIQSAHLHVPVRLVFKAMDSFAQMRMNVLKVQTTTAIQMPTAPTQLVHIHARAPLATKEMV
jgi:hypothetical protein